MTDNFQIDESDIPFVLDVAIQQERDATFAELTNLTATFGTLGPSAELYSNRIAWHQRYAAHLDKLDEAQLEALANAQAAVTTAESTANANLVAAGICTEDTLWAFADKLAYNSDVAEARGWLQRISEWTTQGSRTVNAKGLAYCSERYAELQR